MFQAGQSQVVRSLLKLSTNPRLVVNLFMFLKPESRPLAHGTKCVDAIGPRNGFESAHSVCAEVTLFRLFRPHKFHLSKMSWVEQKHREHQGPRMPPNPTTVTHIPVQREHHETEEASAFLGGDLPPFAQRAAILLPTGLSGQAKNLVFGGVRPGLPHRARPRAQSHQSRLHRPAPVRRRGGSV